MARSRALLGPVRAAPRRPHPERAPSARRRAAARGPRRPGRDASRRDLHGLSVRPAAPQPRALHARTRDRDSADDLGRGRLAAHDDGEGIPTVEVPAPAGLTPQPHPPAPRARGLRRRHAADRVPMAALAVAGRAVQPARAAGPPAALRPRDDRQPLQAGARRPASAVALLQRVDDRRVRAASTSSRWPASSATTTAPSSTTSTSRATRRAASTFA